MITWAYLLLLAVCVYCSVLGYVNVRARAVISLPRRIIEAPIIVNFKEFFGIKFFFMIEFTITTSAQDLE